MFTTFSFFVPKSVKFVITLIMDAYLDILREWEGRVADPAIYEHLDVLFPEFSFRRMQPGGPRDHWASRFKADLSLPKRRNAEKTVVYRSEMRFREQGEWSEGVRVMDRIMQDNGLATLYAAYVWADSMLGLGMPRPDSAEVSAAIARSEKRTQLLDTLQDYFRWNFLNNKSAKAASVRSYVCAERGFSMEEAVAFSLGFVPDWGRVVRYVTDKGFTLDELDDACGVRAADGYTAVGKTHCLAVPYVCAGLLKGFLFRRTQPGDGPKYLASAELDRKSVFFNMPAAPPEGGIVIMEGEFDALKATAAGVVGAVAIGGSAIAGDRRRQVEDALGRGVKRITLCLDLDPDKESGAPNLEAFREHVLRSIHTIKDVDLSFEEIYVAVFPEASDPDEFIRARGGESFKALLANAVPYWKYLSGVPEGR